MQQVNSDFQILLEICQFIILLFHIAQPRNPSEAPQPPPEGNPDDLAALRNQPQLQQLRQLVQQNPALLQQIIQQVDPQLLPVKLIILFSKIKLIHIIYIRS